MSNEQGWGATASLQGSIQSLSEQVHTHKARADEAAAATVAAQEKWIAAQEKLNAIHSVTSYVFHNEALATNEPLRKFAYAVAKILDGEK